MLWKKNIVVAGIAANPLKQEATLVYMDQIIPLGSIINQMFSKTMQWVEPFRVNCLILKMSGLVN